MDGKIKNFRDLDIWNKGMEIVQNVYEITNTYPKEELYGLSAHTRKTAISLPSNVAEGFSRRNNKEYRQFLYIALGSASELETQLEIASRLKYLKDEQLKSILDKTNHFSRMTMNLIKLL